MPGYPDDHLGQRAEAATGRRESDEMAEPTLQEAIDTVRCFAREYDEQTGFSERMTAALMAVLAAAESAAADRERADANERDAGRYRVLRRAFSRHSPSVWFDDEATAEGYTDATVDEIAAADALAAAPNAGQA